MKIILPYGSREELKLAEDTFWNILRDLKQNPVEAVVARNGRIVGEPDRVGSENEFILK